MIQRSDHHISARASIVPGGPVMTLQISNRVRRRCSLALLCIAAAIFGQSDAALASRPGPTPSVLTSPMGGGSGGQVRSRLKGIVETRRGIEGTTPG